MQKNVTRIIAVILAVILAVVAFVVPVFAEEDCCDEGTDNGGYVMPENPDHRDIDGEFVSERGSIIIGHHGASGTPGEYYFHKYGAYKILDKFYMGNGNDGKPVYQYRITEAFKDFKPEGYRFNPITGAIYVADGEREEEGSGAPGETWEDTLSIITIFRRLTGEDGLMTDNTNSGVISSLAAQLQRYVREKGIEPTVTFEAGMAYRVVYGYYLILELENWAEEPDGIVSTKPILANVDECGVVLVSKDSRVVLDKEIVENNQDYKENDYAIGDTIHYRVDSNFPTYAAEVEPGDILFKFTDSLSEGQVFNPDSLIITTHKQGVVEDILLKQGENYRATMAGSELAVDFSGQTVLDYAGCTLKFEYSTTLTAEAMGNVYPASDNHAMIEFKNNPGISDEVNRVEDETKVFTYILDFQKLKDETQEYMKGAKFRLDYKAPNGLQEKSLVFTKKTEGNVDIYIPSATGVTEIETDGKEIRFYGLDAGSYKLVETSAPIGFAILRDPIVFTLTAETELIDPESNKTQMTGTAVIVTANTVKYDNQDDLTLGHSSRASNANLIVRNYEGVSIPETGSVASVIIMIIGGIVILGGIIFFIIKSKKDRDDDDDDE